MRITATLDNVNYPSILFTHETRLGQNGDVMERIDADLGLGKPTKFHPSRHQLDFMKLEFHPEVTWPFEMNI